MNQSRSARRWLPAAAVFLTIGAMASVLFWFWLHRGGQAIKHLKTVTISGFDRVALKELGSNGSGDYPPTAEAYFIGPPGDTEVKAPGFTFTKVDPPDDMPGMKVTVLYRGDAPPNCILDIERLYPTSQIPKWVHFSAQQRSAFERGSMQVLEAGVACGG